MCFIALVFKDFFPHKYYLKERSNIFKLETRLVIIMRNTGICPKCNNREIAGPHRLHADERHLKIDLPGLSTATLEAFTCLNCGYTELFPDVGGMNNLRRSGRRYQV